MNDKSNNISFFLEDSYQKDLVDIETMMNNFDKHNIKDEKIYEDKDWSEYGMDVKTREQLDDKVIERAKELTTQEKNNIARKEAIEFGQRRESDKRAAEGLKARDKMIKNKMKNMSPQQKQNYINFLRESGW